MECEKWNLLGWGYSIVPDQTKATSPCPLIQLDVLFGHEGFIDDRSHVGSLHVQWEMLSEK